MSFNILKAPWLKSSMFLQSEGKKCYFVILHNISSKLCVLIANLFRNLPSVIFREKLGNPEKSGMYSNFQFLCKSIDNVKILFLTIVRWKILIFAKVMSFSVFTNLQGHWSGFTKIVVGTFQKKAVTFEEIELEPSNFAILCLTWCQ